MDPSRFVTTEYGRVRTEVESGVSWFDPAPLPRAVPLNDETLLALSRADDALGRLAGVGQLLPQEELLIRPYAMKEALASARIEGTQADLQSAFKEQAKPSPSRIYAEVAKVVRYLRALERGLAELDDRDHLDFEVVGAVHKILMDDETGQDQIRQQMVWHGSPTDRPENAEFVPPIGAAIKRAIHEWTAYLREPSTVPSLVRAALVHYQFLTIHPFIDGNGRAGRLLVLLFLTTEGRLPVPLLYLSPYFEVRRREYYDRLQAVRERGQIQEWLQFFCTAVEAQAKDGVTRARELLDLRERYRSELAGSRSRSSEVVELLFQNPVVYAALVRDSLQMSNQGALNLLAGLERRGWLAQIGTAGRGGAKLWLATEVLDAIESPVALRTASSDAASTR